MPKIGNEATDVIASLVVHGVSEMTPQGRKQIARWLRRQAKFITDEGDNIAPRYRARWHIARPETTP